MVNEGIGGEKMEIYSNNIRVVETIKKEYGAVTPEAAYVDMDTEVLSEQGLAPSDLAKKLTKENPDRKIIMFGWLPMRELWLRTEFRAAMSNRNVEYARLPLTADEISSIYESSRPENPAFRAAANLQQETGIVAKFKHEWKYEDRRENILKQAREKLGWDGSDGDIEQRIISYAPSATVAPSYFPGVFCDVEGTVLKQGCIDEMLYHELKIMSFAAPVTLWTGADIKDYSYLVSKLGYPLLSKHWFRGSTVEQAIDDDPKELFEANYGITAKDYRKV